MQKRPPVSPTGSGLPYPACFPNTCPAPEAMPLSASPGRKHWRCPQDSPSNPSATCVSPATVPFATPIPPQTAPTPPRQSSPPVPATPLSCRAFSSCLLYTSDAADDLLCVDL